MLLLLLLLLELLQLLPIENRQAENSILLQYDARLYQWKENMHNHNHMPNTQACTLHIFSLSVCHCCCCFCWHRYVCSSKLVDCTTFSLTITHNLVICFSLSLFLPRHNLTDFRIASHKLCVSINRKKEMEIKRERNGETNTAFGQRNHRNGIFSVTLN